MKNEMRRATIMRSTHRPMRGANPLNNEESTAIVGCSCARRPATTQEEANPIIMTMRALGTFLGLRATREGFSLLHVAGEDVELKRNSLTNSSFSQTNSWGKKRTSLPRLLQT
jgi:hypothetical protein